MSTAATIQALLFQAKTGMVTRMDSSCPPIGMFSEETCELASADLVAGDVMVFYTDGVTEAQNQSGEEFGMERLSAVVQSRFFIVRGRTDGRYLPQRSQISAARLVSRMM